MHEFLKGRDRGKLRMPSESVLHASEIIGDIMSSLIKHSEFPSTKNNLTVLNKISRIKIGRQDVNH